MKRQTAYITIGDKRPEVRLEQLRAQLRDAEKNEERTGELAKEIIRCQHNLTGLRRLFEHPVKNVRHIQTALDVIEQKERNRRQVEDWMDDLCPTVYTEKEELRTTLRKLERFRHLTEGVPHLATKWSRLYADVFILLNRDDYGSE